ncbi:hypothetical protein ACE7GA_09495 [Roseomonas sp. CCTCC AB2023176]|uniref:DUF7002 family protein n=1 Tax=Roseomonas sp. CCTCC AB2023176 TaxID=3342640 RepID=UPI0035D834EB
MGDGAARFAARFPRAFHVTDRANLPGIARDGLLSAEALAALYAVPDADRLLSENRGRGHFVHLSRDGLPGATLRDQWMPDEPLTACLRGAYAGRPDWWRCLINAHVFLWLSEPQARRLAAVNRARDQVVLAFETAPLLAATAGRAFTTPINTGIATGRYGRPGSPRDETTFHPVAETPRPDRRTLKELAIRGGTGPGLPHAVLDP